MNALLQKKLDELKNAKEFECWYLVKHSTNFGHLCYLVSFLKDYMEHVGSSRNLESYSFRFFLLGLLLFYRGYYFQLLTRFY